VPETQNGEFVEAESMYSHATQTEHLATHPKHLGEYVQQASEFYNGLMSAGIPYHIVEDMVRDWHRALLNNSPNVPTHFFLSPPARPEYIHTVNEHKLREQIEATIQQAPHPIS